MVDGDPTPDRIGGIDDELGRPPLVPVFPVAWPWRLLALALLVEWLWW